MSELEAKPDPDAGRPRPTDRLAITALVFGLFGIFGFTIIVSVVLAILALRRVKLGTASGQRFAKWAFVASGVWVLAFAIVIVLAVTDNNVVKPTRDASGAIT